jgi:hypothetical protein
VGFVGLLSTHEQPSTMTTAIPSATLRQYLLSDRFRPLPHVLWARHADATVLLDADRGKYYTLNEVAGRVWELVAAGEPVLEILRLLGEEYDAPVETLEGDMTGLLDRLLETQLIEREAV